MTNNNPMIITFYTPNWKYGEYAAEIGKKCNQFGMEFYSKEYPSSENYLTHTRIKPRFVLETLLEFKRPVMWIDADASLHKRIDLFDSEDVYDIGLNPKQIPDGRVWHVGTMYFNYTEKTLRLLELWNEQNESEGYGGSDELSFDITWKKYGKDLGLSVFHLPNTCHYLGIMSNHTGTPPPDVYVAHRASRHDVKQKTMQHYLSTHNKTTGMKR